MPLCTYDAKAQRGQRLKRPVCDDDNVAEVLRVLFSEFEREEETWANKSRQSFFSWGFSTWIATCLLTQKGFRSAAQSRREDVTMELVRRVRYMLTHLPPEWAEVVELERPHPTGGVKVNRVLGEEHSSFFFALPEGADQWRFEQLTVACFDEAAYNRYMRASYAGHLPCVQGGGKSVIMSTPAVGTFFNETVESIRTAGEVVYEAPSLAQMLAEEGQAHATS